MPGAVSSCRSHDDMYGVPVPRRCPLLLLHSWARPSIRGPLRSCLIAGGLRLPLVAWLIHVSICQHDGPSEQWVHTSAEILLVRKHQQQRILHFPVLDDPCELRPCLVDAVAVVRVDNEDKALGAYSTVNKCALLS
jgi:hypothetical protein